MAIKKPGKTPNINNPFVLIQAILLGTIRLLAIILGWILSVATLAVKYWVWSLLITALVFVLLYTFGVI